MKNTERLNHQEILTGLALCYRELIETEVSNRNMPNIINRGRAVAAVVTAHHREEIMETRRTSAMLAVRSAEVPTVKRLRPAKKAK